jgi:hypothetical protein
MEKQMGVTLPSPEDKLPPEVEVQLSQLIAQAGKQLLEENKGEAAQQQAQQMQQDPLVQMQQQDLAIKQKDADTKAQKVQMDAQAKQQALANEATRIANQKEVDFARLAVDARKHEETLKVTANNERTRMGVDAAKTAAQIAAQRNKGNQ